MARRDGTGPLGQGPLTGRGFGVCNTGQPMRGGAGMGRGAGMRGGIGRGCGFGRGYGLGANVGFSQVDAKTDKEFLKQQKEILEDRLNSISKQLEDE